MFRKLMIAALAANCLAVPVAAQVLPASIVLKFTDLDLSRARDVRRLDLRIARAAADVCRPESMLDPIARKTAARCTRETVDAVKYKRDRAVAEFAREPELSSR